MDHFFCNQSFCNYDEDEYWPDYEEEWEEDWFIPELEHEFHHVPVPKLIHVFDICSLCVANGSVLANGTVIVIYLFLLKSNMKKIPNMMLMNQALGDVLVSLYAILSVVPNHVRSLMFNPVSVIMKVCF